MKPSIPMTTEMPSSVEQTDHTPTEPGASPTSDRATERRLPEPEGDNVEEFLEAYPHLFKE